MSIRKKASEACHSSSSDVAALVFLILAASTKAGRSVQRASRNAIAVFGAFAFILLRNMEMNPMPDRPRDAIGWRPECHFDRGVCQSRVREGKESRRPRWKAPGSASDRSDDILCVYFGCVPWPSLGAVARRSWYGSDR